MSTVTSVNHVTKLPSPNNSNAGICDSSMRMEKVKQTYSPFHGDEFHGIPIRIKSSKKQIQFNSLGAFSKHGWNFRVFEA